MGRQDSFWEQTSREDVVPRGLPDLPADVAGDVGGHVLVELGPQDVDHLKSHQIIGLEFRKHFHHALVATIVELPDHVGADVGRRHQDAEQFAAGT